MAPYWATASRESNGHVTQTQHHYFIAQAYYANGAYERALGEVDRAIGLDPKNAGHHLLRSRILAMMDRSEAAFEAAKRALDTDPSTNETELLALCEDFYTRHAEVIYSRLINNGSKSVLPYTGLADIALHANDVSQAARRLAQAAEIDAKHPRVLFGRAKLEKARGNFAEAIALLEQTRNLGEDSAGLFSALGEAYSDSKQWDKAAAAYERALRRHRNNTAWRLGWARALHHGGQYRAAEEKYRELLAIKPEFTEAWRGLRALRKYF
jgi:tetratricopeptide (TPR) repeat protein